MSQWALPMHMQNEQKAFVFHNIKGARNSDWPCDPMPPNFRTGQHIIKGPRHTKNKSYVPFLMNKHPYHRAFALNGSKDQQCLMTASNLENLAIYYLGL